MLTWRPLPAAELSDQGSKSLRKTRLRMLSSYEWGYVLVQRLAVSALSEPKSGIHLIIMETGRKRFGGV